MSERKSLQKQKKEVFIPFNPFALRFIYIKGHVAKCIYFLSMLWSIFDINFVFLIRVKNLVAPTKKDTCSQRFEQTKKLDLTIVKMGSKGVTLDQVNLLINHLNLVAGGELYVSPKLIFGETKQEAETIQQELYTRSADTFWVDNSILWSTEQARTEVDYVLTKLEKTKMAFLGQVVISAVNQKGGRYVDSLHTQALYMDLSSHRAVLFEPMAQPSVSVKTPGPTSPLGQLALSQKYHIKAFRIMRGQQKPGEVNCMIRTIEWLHNISCGASPCDHLTEEWQLSTQATGVANPGGQNTPTANLPGAALALSAANNPNTPKNQHGANNPGGAPATAAQHGRPQASLPPGAAQSATPQAGIHKPQIAIKTVRTPITQRMSQPTPRPTPSMKPATPRGRGSMKHGTPRGGQHEASHTSGREANHTSDGAQHEASDAHGEANHTSDGAKHEATDAHDEANITATNKGTSTKDVSTTGKQQKVGDVNAKQLLNLELLQI